VIAGNCATGRKGADAPAKVIRIASTDAKTDAVG
jgi:hypothetical protein